METVNVTVRMERQTRDDAAQLFSELGISTTQAINMFLKQAVREGDPLRGNRKTRRRARQREHGEAAHLPIASAAAAPLQLGQPPSQVYCAFDRSKV